MVPGIFPSQLVILSTGQTYFDTCEEPDGAAAAG